MFKYLPALSDPSYMSFLWLVSSILLLIGSLLFCLKLNKKTKPFAEKVWIAFLPWLIMAPLGFLFVGLGTKFFIAALCILSILCVKEFSRATGLYEDWSFVVTIYSGVILIYLAAWLNWYGLFVSAPVFIIAALLMIPSLRNDYENMLQKIGLSTIAVIYFSWFFAHLGFLANHPSSYSYLLFLIIGTELNDASAFLIGKIFGKHKLVSKVSPGKTIEGAIGAFIIISIYVWGVHNWIFGFHLGTLLLSILIISIGGILGDLVMSFFKRDIGIKDMGQLIPGHGGLLDRLDSLIFVSPLYFHMIKFFIKFPT